jgi:hypothetical protein
MTTVTVRLSKEVVACVDEVMKWYPHLTTRAEAIAVMVKNEHFFIKAQRRRMKARG